MRTPLAVALLALFASACSTAPKKPFEPAPAEPGSASVYFYRQSEMTGLLLRPSLSANGAALGKISKDSCAVVHLPPGAAELRSVWPGIPGTSRDDTAAVNVEAGKNYYVRVRYHQNKPHKAAPGVPAASALVYEDRPGLEEVEASEALAQMGHWASCAALGAAK
ncbi:MAG TPA: DUF2846 domain-containing protein [Elusimicrobiota bacterium]|nr:DUF2846 domain-containing protein [Elusimicrobiota bacterium]